MLFGLKRLGTDSVKMGVVLLAIGACLPAWGKPQTLLPDITKGNIGISLAPIATGMSAPLYGINPPGDTSRLFVLEQNGLVRIIQNGILQSGSALNLQSRVQIAPVGNGPLNPGN